MRLILYTVILAHTLSLSAQNYINDSRLFEQGSRIIYQGENLTNISFPLGGIGGGCIHMNGQGERQMWQIFNNFTPATMPQSFFAIQAQAIGQAPVARQLQTNSGEFLPMDSLVFEGEYPLGWYTFFDDNLPVSVEMEVFSPFIPLDAKSSAIPCAIYTIKAKNNSTIDVEVNLLGTQKNPIGYSGSPIYHAEISPITLEGNIIEDFEDGTYNKWLKTGNAFGNFPSTTGNNGNTGAYFARSNIIGTGSLTLDTFSINSRYIHFQISGNRDFNNQHKIGISLSINDTIVEFASGQAQDSLYWDYFDLENFQGETATLKIIDQFATKFIAIDHIFESNDLLQVTNTIVFEDFENDSTLQDWIKTGDAFNNLPSNSSVGIQELRGFMGNGFLNSFDDGNNGSDALMGSLTSPEFEVNHSSIYFLIGGGSSASTSINLLIDNVMVKSSSGADRDIMAIQSWNVLAYLGKTAKIQILDQNSGNWGHIEVDQIFFSNESLPTTDLVGVGNNVNSIIPYQGTNLLHLSAENNAADMVLFTTAENSIGCADIGNMGNFVSNFTADGSLPLVNSTTPSVVDYSYTGAINVVKTLAPGDSIEVSYVLTWSFPDYTHGVGNWSYSGNKYNVWWNNAREVAEYVIDNLDYLKTATKAYHNAVYASNLPHYVLDRITSQTAILKAKTAFWAKNNVYANWEGLFYDQPLGEGSCNHVVHYAQAHARLFPVLAQSRRASAFSNQTDEGGFVHRQPDNFVVFDGQCGEIMSCYREHLMTTDNQWLTDHWDNIRKAMDYVINRWDNDRDGLMSGPQWTTLDANVGGISSWMGTMYLAALSASVEMAKLMDDQNSINNYAEILANGRLAQNELLWNGEYFIQVNEETPQRDYLTGSALDQLLGEYWVNQVGLPSGLYDTSRIKQALKALYKNNFRDSMEGYVQFPRKFLDDKDGGFQMITWPNGGRPNVYPYYAAEVMSGFEYSTIATMINYGLLEEGFSALLAIFDRYNGRKRNNLDDFIWGYSGNPFGDDEWGKWYYRAMSSWSILIASQGYIYDGPKNKIGFRPQWQPKEHSSFFTASEAWGVFYQQIEETILEASIDVRYGQLDVKTIVLEWADLNTPNISVMVNGVPNIPFELDGETITILLNTVEEVVVGEVLNILLSKQTTSVHQTNYSDNIISIYPNPISDYLSISSKEVIHQIELYDLNGSLIYSKNFDNSTITIVTANFPNGHYFITLSGSNFTHTEKILITK